MLEFFQYATSGFWTFIGCIVILVVLTDVVLEFIRMLIRSR